MIFEIILMLLAAIVFVGQTQHKNVWLFICTYWGVLTIKYIYNNYMTHKEKK